MTATTDKAMKIETTGRRVVMFGKRPENGEWFERYYPTVEAARKYAGKRGWVVEVREAA